MSRTSDPLTRFGPFLRQNRARIASSPRLRAMFQSLVLVDTMNHLRPEIPGRVVVLVDAVVQPLIKETRTVSLQLVINFMEMPVIVWKARLLRTATPGCCCSVTKKFGPCPQIHSTLCKRRC